MTIAASVRRRPEAARAGFAEKFLRGKLAGLRYGRIAVTLPDGIRVEQCGALPGPEAAIILHDWKAPLALLLGGDTGFAEAYIAGSWSSPDLTAFLTLGALNFADLPVAWPLALARRLRHAGNANSRAGARRNIMAHYDLGNAFYAAWLDAQMLYSSALFSGPGQTLEDAQAAKLALVRDWLAAQSGAEILEIGSGWGALALDLARSGAKVTGLTLSEAQLRYAQAEAQRLGLAGRARFLLRDYRDAQGKFDRIVSIEMLEAVGEEYWPEYFATLRSCLKPGGKAVLQVITIDAARYGNYRRNPDFIQRHVFPGGMLPPKAAIAAQAAAAGLAPGRVLHFGESYARTLAAWRQRFLQAWPRIAPLGFDERFRRLWEYYLAYCEAGFRAGAIDVGLYEFSG